MALGDLVPVRAVVAEFRVVPIYNYGEKDAHRADRLVLVLRNVQVAGKPHSKREVRKTIGERFTRGWANSNSKLRNSASPNGEWAENFRVGQVIEFKTRRPDTLAYPVNVCGVRGKPGIGETVAEFKARMDREWAGRLIGKAEPKEIIHPKREDGSGRAWDASVHSTSARTRLKMSQPEFAEMLGVPAATVRNWEQQRTLPDAAARALLRITYTHPRLVRDILQMKIT